MHNAMADTSLYIHIPFCGSKCAYCSFYSMPVGKQPVDEFIEAIGKEWLMRRHELDKDPETIYIGGGTPSLLTPGRFERLCAFLPVSDRVEEFTVEANPDDVTLEKAAVWKRCGVNRVSMGVQSLQDIELRAVGRRHDSAMAVAAYRILRNAGIDNISLDLIFGLPSQTFASWKNSVDRIVTIRPEHLSAYMLSVEQGTRLYARMLKGEFHEHDEETLVRMYDYLCEQAAQSGYEHYEISNFALPAHRAVHNSNYWKFRPYVGLGPSAHSFDGHCRRVNCSSLKTYLARIDNGIPAYEIEDEDDVDILNDRIMVALRTSHGLDLSELPTEARTRLMKSAEKFIPERMHMHQGHLIINENSYMVSDAIIRELLLDRP